MVEHSSVSGRSYLGNPSLYLVISGISSKCFGTLFHCSYDILGDNLTTAETYPGQTQLLVGDTGLICISFLLLIVVLKYLVFDARAKVQANKADITNNQ